MPPTPCTCSAPICCTRCGNALGNPWAKVRVETTDGKSHIRPLCSDCHGELMEFFRPSLETVAKYERDQAERN